jgi:hypothetical protein
MNLKTNRRFLAGFALPGMMLQVSFASLLMFTANSALHPRQWLNQIALSPHLTQQDRDASDQLSQDIRDARSVRSAAPNQIVLDSPGRDIVYAYNPAARTLTRIEGARNEVLLTDLDALSFSLFQQPGAKDAFNTFSPATVENARLVSCRWSSSQRIAGRKIESDSFQMSATALHSR